ncbi:MAG: substrate-binding domain-containing protein [Eubacteriales bacterium]|nr:substrate-binding domain-containing protein [Eubacteriales bacterium]
MKKNMSSFGRSIYILGLAGLSAMLISACGKGGNPAETIAASSAAETTAKSAAEGAEAGNAEASQTGDADGKDAAGTSAATELKLPDYKFTFDNFPRMDGSTATVPLAKSVAGALLGVKPEETAELCRFNRTTQSFRNLMNGEADVLIVGEPKASVYEELKAANFEIEVEDIATDALIFVVNENNPVSSLTTDQIRDIYLGKITNWKEVGGNDAEIIPFQRNEGAGSQALMTKLVMKDEAMMAAPKEYVQTSMGDLMTAVKSYDNSANAIGYSVYYYANDMKMAKGLKIIGVDGVDPGTDTIRSGKYPHLNAYYCVVPKDTANEGARAIYDWLASDDGQRLIAGEGYVSIKDIPSANAAAGKTDKVAEALYERLDGAAEGTLDELKVRSDYGMLLPYKGSELYENISAEGSDDPNSYISGYMMGFFDTNGRLVTDPVYNVIQIVQYYDRYTDNMQSLPFYVFAKYDNDMTLPEDGDMWSLPDDKVHQRFVTLDGSFISDEYGHISGCDGGNLLCKPTFEAKEFKLYDKDAGVILDYDMLAEANGESFTAKLDEDYGLTEVGYGEGYFTISLKDGEYFVNEETKKLEFGPYSYIRPFHDGMAMVRYGDMNEANIIDKTGKKILDTDYSEVSTLKNGNIIAGNEKDTYIYDKSGKLIKKLDNTGYFNTTEWGFTTQPYVSKETGYGCAAYDFDGNLLFSDMEGVYSFNSVLPIVTITGDSIDAKADEYNENGTGLRVTNLLTKDSIFIEGASEAYPFYTMEGHAEISLMTAVNYDYDTDTNRVWIFDEKPSIVSDTDKFGPDTYVNATMDMKTGEWYIVAHHSKTNICEIYDKELNKINEVTNYPELIGGIAIYEAEHACIADDVDGHRLFCYPMIGSLGN